MKTPVMMVHGMSCTGQVWTQFRSLFERRGARVYTPTLRPDHRVNVKSKPPRTLASLRLHDYVADLTKEVELIREETGVLPAVIGHSMGGLLTQALAERGLCSAAVLISPATPAGVFTFRTRMVFAGYGFARVCKLAPPVIRADRRTLDAMVLNVMPPSARAEIAANMVFESGTVFADFANFPIDETKIKVPLLTIAATRDRLVYASQVRRTAKKYAAIGGEFREYAEHGHWLYAEPGWEKPANEIYEWLELATDKDSLRPALHVATAATQPGSGL